MTVDREELEAELRRVYERVDCLATENAGLKRDVDQQMAIANSEANLAEELRAENAALVARVERLEEALRQLRGNGDASGTWTEDAVRFPQMLSTRAKTMGMKMQQIEPVAWMYDNTFERCTYPIRKNHTLTPEDGWAEIPLYAQPQPSLVPGQSVDLVEVVDAEAARTFISEWPHHSFADFIEPALAEAFARHRRSAIAAMDNATDKQIVAWLRAKPTGLGCRYEPSLLADAIERGAHKEHQP